MPAYLIPDTANVGNYTGNSGQGFTAIDAILGALHACGKVPDSRGRLRPLRKLRGSQRDGAELHVSRQRLWSLHVCERYRHGQRLWRHDEHARLAARLYGEHLAGRLERFGDCGDARRTALATTPTRRSTRLACSTTTPRYPSLRPTRRAMTRRRFNNQYRTYLDRCSNGLPDDERHGDARLCGLIPAQDQHGPRSACGRCMARWRTTIRCSLNAMSRARRLYTGAAGRGTDYRGVVRYFEAVETPDMCGDALGNNTPASIFDLCKTATRTSDRAGRAISWSRWRRSVIRLTGWAAWKTFIASKSGKVMNGRDSTLRTPAEVKTSWCESGMTCQ